MKTNISYSLVSSADKVFRGAQEKYIDKDEEAAYVQYMRFIELVLLLQKRPDFKKVCKCFIFPHFYHFSKDYLFICFRTTLDKKIITKDFSKKIYKCLYYFKC